MDFIGIAADQLINNAAKLRFMTAGRTTAPITVRTQVYGGLATGATHSQTLEAWFMHIPGMKVIVPSTPRDGKGLLASAIFDDDPCLFVETIRLQGQKGPVPIDPGLPDSAGPGRHQAAGHGRHADQLRPQRARMRSRRQRRWTEQGVSAEVVDLRTLVPLDVDTIVESVRRTRRAVVVHDAVQFAGPGAEIVADPAVRAVRRARRTRSNGWRPGSSRHPPQPTLEAQVYPSPARIVAAAQRTFEKAGCAWLTSSFASRASRWRSSEAELTELLVDAGQHVEEGTPIYVDRHRKGGTGDRSGCVGHRAMDRRGRHHLRHRRRNRRHHIIAKGRSYGSQRDPRANHLRKGQARSRKITLNWPEKANAQDQKLAEEVDAALLDADRDYDIKVLVLKANGKGFCSGHAIGNNAVDYPAFVEGAMMMGHPWKPQSDLFVKPTLNLWEFSKPTIAQVHGYCVGGGTHMGLTTDIVIASEDAYFSYPPLQGFGMPSGECSIEPWVFMNWRRAAYYLFTAEVIDAKKALEVGLVNEVVKREDLDARVDAIARHIAQAPLTTLLATKANLKRAWELMGMRVHWQSSNDLVALASISKDVQELIQTVFKDKMLPSEHGRATGRGRLDRRRIGHVGSAVGEHRRPRDQRRAVAGADHGGRRRGLLRRAVRQEPTGRRGCCTRPGCGRGDGVALVLPNRPEFFEITWGCQLSGLYYTRGEHPLHPRRGRLRHRRLRRQGGLRRRVDGGPRARISATPTPVSTSTSRSAARCPAGGRTTTSWPRPATRRRIRTARRCCIRRAPPGGPRPCAGRCRTDGQRLVGAGGAGDGAGPAYGMTADERVPVTRAAVSRGRGQLHDGGQSGRARPRS